MSISGLHITLIPGVFAIITMLLGQCLRIQIARLKKASLIVGFISTSIYALISGFDLPVQRAWTMLLIASTLLLIRHPLTRTQIVSMTMLVILIIDPLSVLSIGFWLSFLTVTLLILISTYHRGQHAIVSFLKIQWRLSIILIPILIFFFQFFSISSPLANIVAIPIIGFLVVPLILISILPGLDFLAFLSQQITKWLLYYLDFLSSTFITGIHWPSISLVSALLGTVGFWWLTLPKGFPARYLGLVFCLPLLNTPISRPETGEFVVRVLDVGQGLSIHIQIKKNNFLFDTGTAFHSESNVGNKIIVPYLQAQKVSHLSRLVISHKDSDHFGGAISVLDTIPTKSILGSLPIEQQELQPYQNKRTRCYAGQSWEWDQVYFEVLHPPKSFYQEKVKTNDLSCVIKVHNHQYAFLITADIEKKSEKWLINNQIGKLSADSLLAPHHGSLTSSSTDFIQSSNASYIILPVGYLNRYKHPRQEVIKRYQQNKIKSSGQSAILLSTARNGAITFNIKKNGFEVKKMRLLSKRYWHDHDDFL